MDSGDRGAPDGGEASDAPSGEDEATATDGVAALAEREGWRPDDYAARVHYRGAEDYYSVEYYAPSDCVLYWKVKGDGATAVPVGRHTVPEPLRARIRQDLRGAGIDPDVENREL